jgi:hypothetical protein
MISSQEFQQKLQAGQIHEALAIVVRDTSELEIVTQMSEASLASTQSVSREYLRTKINLLTGEIYNEVSKDLVGNHDNYRQLQQLHTERIVASHRQVQGYLHQIEAILRVISPPSIESRSSIDTERLERLDSASLGTLLNRSTARSIDDESTSIQQPESTAPDTLTLIDRVGDGLPDDSPPWEPTPPPLPQETLAQQSPALDRSLIENTDPIGFDELGVGSLATGMLIDDDLDLSIDEAAEVWEEWVEDDDFLSAVLPQPPSASSASIPNWQDRLVRRHLNPIDVKPITPRVTAESVDPLARWDKFEPEYIGISTDDSPQHQRSTERDSHQMDKLIADLDI